MAGRGRGRGRGANMSFNIESLGFGRGEALPTAIVEPRPTYPVRYCIIAHFTFILIHCVNAKSPSISFFFFEILKIG